VRALHAVLLQQSEFLAHRGQPNRRQVRRKKLSRMRLEGHHAGRQPARRRCRAQLREHCLVAEMDPVKIADGQRDGTGGSVRNAAQDLHGTRLILWKSTLKG